MSEARNDILARVRSATGGAEPDYAERYAALPREYKREGTLDFDGKLQLFADRIHDYDGVLHTCGKDQVVATIAAALSARGKRRIVVPPDYPEASLPKGFEFVWDHELTYEALDECDGVITGCTVAIALTGTIVLQDGLYQGRRALSLVPDYHLCLVGRNQIYEMAPEAIQVLSHTGARVTTFISGPSATSDIEMTRIKGVHGPRTLEVIVIC
jgi:L-lactate dehydrogenase complex protein LldG